MFSVEFSLDFGTVVLYNDNVFYTETEKENKNMAKRLLAVLLLAAMLLTMLVACNTPEEQPQDTEASAEDESVLTVIKDGATDFKIVYSFWEVGNAPLLEARIQTLIKTIKQRTGVEMKVVQSNKYENKPEDYCIFIGNTELAESLEAVKDMRRRDYRIVRNGNKIVIVGGNTDTLINAVTNFTSKVISQQTKEDGSLVVFGAEHEIRYSATYALNQFEAGDRDLKDYTIVMPKNYTMGEHQTAYYIRDLIANHYGYLLPVENDVKTYENEILVGKTARSTLTVEKTEYAVEISNGKIQLAAGCTNAWAGIEQTFYNNFLKSGKVTNVKSNINATLEARNDSILEKKGDIRIIFHNILSYLNDGQTEHINLPLRWELQANIYTEYDADLICLQEFNNLPRDRNDGLKNRLTKLGYAEVPYDPNLDGDTPIFYKPEKFDLLTQGTYVYNTPNNDNERYGGYAKMTIWAIFREKSTGKVFCLASSHLDHQDTVDSNARRASEALELIELFNTVLVGEYANIPLILGGDLNTSYNRENNKYGNTGALKNFETVGGYVNVQTTMPGADQAGIWCNPPSYNKDTHLMTPGTSTSDAMAAIDHCMYKGNATPVTFDVLEDSYARMASDHLPFVVDFELN